MYIAHYKVGDRVALDVDKEESQPVPVGTIGTVARNADASKFTWVEWDTMGGKATPVRRYLLRIVESAPARIEPPAQPCGTPWWHLWNPCSRFGWMTYMVGGAFVPSIVESLFA